MKRLLLASTILFGAGIANAADMTPLPRKAPPTEPAPASSWTGGYIGVDGGYASGNFDINTSTALSSTNFTAKDTGFFGGGFAGYNYQIGSFVFGGESDINISTQKATSGTVTTSVVNGGTRSAAAAVNITEPWFATARGRIGYLVTTNILIYGTGGGAYGNVQAVVPINGSTTINIPGVGWVAGGGIEGKIGDYLLTRVEYRHMDLSGPSANSTVFNVNTHANSDVVLGGIGLKLH